MLLRSITTLDIYIFVLTLHQIPTLVALYQHIRAVYSQSEQIYMVQDNRSVHVHPDVLVALEAQTTPLPRIVLPSWPTTSSAATQQKWAYLRLAIQVVSLPTYASWTNPIEKLWHKLRQEMTHLHR